MRTSRISTDTARLVSAMAISSQRTLRSSTRAAANRQRGSSRLSPVSLRGEPSDLSPGRMIAPQVLTLSQSKRKRSAQAMANEDQDDNKDDRIISKRLATKSRKKTAVVHHSPPPDWEDLYNRVKAMRERNPTAPVDYIGCTKLFVEESSPRDKRLQILISLMLSAQTKDETTAAAMKRLHLELGEGLRLSARTPSGQEGKEEGKGRLEEEESKVHEVSAGNIMPKTSSLTLENLIAVPAPRLDELIRQVNFHNNKTKYIKATALMIRDDFDSDIPSTPEGLMRLPGVGPKMAYLAMDAAWGRVLGIGVDVHVHRITNLWGWVKTKTPEETRIALESWLPKEKWGEINKLLVGVGQTIKDPAQMKNLEWWKEYDRREKLKVDEAKVVTLNEEAISIKVESIN
ncbi:Endonuclease III-like protein 1 [Ascosphaera aggregata]|nr:Endonuclease III-like protein 1 [Ascosphaera aggregata]